MGKDLHEKILLEGLLEGNVKIFDYLFHYYYSGLVVYAAKIVEEETTAEDIVQEFFFKLWIDRKKHNINQSLKPYFFSAVNNLCLDYLRHKKVSKKAKDYLAQEMLQNIPSEHNLLVESELRVRINDAIDTLPERCKKMFIMNRLEGLKPIEIAQKENLSVRTVEGHIGKALKLLREELQDYLPAYIIALLLS